MTSEHHLGDRLDALVDGELCDDDRERVLAHLATCPGCKAEADARRRMKSVFADIPEPAPPAALLARLQGLPEGPPPGGDGAWPADALPGGRSSSLLTPPSLTPERGFPVFEGNRQAVAAPSFGARGHRLAFAAAGAVSLAAFAIGGALAGSATGGGGSGGTTTVAAAAGGGATPTSAARPLTVREELAGERRALRGTGGGVPQATPSVRLAGVAVSPDVAALLGAGGTFASSPPMGPVAVSRSAAAGTSATPAAQATFWPDLLSPR